MVVVTYEPQNWLPMTCFKLDHWIADYVMKPRSEKSDCVNRLQLYNWYHLTHIKRLLSVLTGCPYRSFCYLLFNNRLWHSASALVTCMAISIPISTLKFLHCICLEIIQNNENENLNCMRYKLDGLHGEQKDVFLDEVALSDQKKLWMKIENEYETIYNWR